MDISFKASMTGHTPVVDALNDVNRELSAGCPAGVAAGVDILADAIAAEMPRRSGRLVRSVAAGPTAVVVGAIYGAVINGGWPRHNIRPNHYEQRGIERATPDIVRAIDDDLQERLDRA